MRNAGSFLRALAAMALFADLRLLSFSCVLAVGLWAASCSSNQACSCAAGNECIDDGSGAACHKVCSGQSQCPAGWYCHEAQVGGRAKSWCIQNWHTPCSARDGEQNNPACAPGFACYGTSPTDANAFCTKFNCGKDTDCPSGWWCATVNQAPNVDNANTAHPTVRAVCLPRVYCAPCQSDADCSPTPDGTPQRCAAGDNGDAFCAPACSASTDCALDATCAVQATICTPAHGQACQTDNDCPPAKGTYQHCQGHQCTPECAGASDCNSNESCLGWGLCAPRAGFCKGDGSFCSPCRSDKDCTNGVCVSAGPYSTETFCTVASRAATCNVMATNPTGCPTRHSGDNWKITQCTPPPNSQCLAEVSFGAGANATFVPGCWTVNR